MLGFSSCGKPKLRTQNLSPRPLYKRVRRRIPLLLLPFFFSATGGRRKREYKEKRERMGEPPFFEVREKNSVFFFIVQTSSKVQSRFVCGLIDLKFGGEVHDLLIFNLNGRDRIWSSKRSYFNLRIEPLFWWVFYPDSFDHELRSRLIRGLIELIFGEHVQNSLIFILTVEIGFGVRNSYISVREQSLYFGEFSIQTALIMSSDQG